MSTILDEVMTTICTFNEDQLQLLYTKILAEFADELKEQEPARIIPRPNCPYCGSSNVWRDGKKHGKQRYLCNACSRTYVSTTNTVMSMSHYSQDVWEFVLDSTMKGDSLDYIRDELARKGVSMCHQTAFDMRHKLLLAMQQYLRENQDETVLGDVCELDETYVPDSYKGRRVPEEAGRPARKHGSVAQKRGLSNELVCICAGVQRKGNVYMQAANRAKPTKEELKQVFDGHIKDNTLILTDGLTGYSVFETSGCEVHNVNKEESGFYNLNSVNNLHSYIKDRLDFYQGVATTYINRYGALFTLSYRDRRQHQSSLEDALFNCSLSKYTFTAKDVRNYELFAA